MGRQGPGSSAGPTEIQTPGAMTLKPRGTSSWHRHSHGGCPGRRLCSLFFLKNINPGRWELEGVSPRDAGPARGLSLRSGPARTLPPPPPILHLPSRPCPRHGTRPAGCRGRAAGSSPGLNGPRPGRAAEPAAASAKVP